MSEKTDAFDNQRGMRPCILLLGRTAGKSGGGRSKRRGAVRGFGGADGCRLRESALREKSGGAASHGEYHQNHDLYPDSGKRRTGGCADGFSLCCRNAKGEAEYVSGRAVPGEGFALFPDAGIP